MTHIWNHMGDADRKTLYAYRNGRNCNHEREHRLLKRIYSRVTAHRCYVDVSKPAPHPESN